MKLGPEDRKNWQGFLDLLQPPSGYRLRAAIGTSFGLSMEGLIAALLSMCDADGEELASNPVAATMAITRMSDRVRVLVHPATVTGRPSNEGSNQFVALLDRLVAQVQPTSGLFHPKVWALRFQHIGPVAHGKPAEVGRLLVGSRNLTRSTSFEVGAVFEGTATEGADSSPISRDVSRALRQWMTAGGHQYPEEVWRLPQFLEQLVFDAPVEATDALRMRWQGLDQKPLVDALGDRLKRVIVVAPFIEADFVSLVLGKTDTLHIVSIPESLDALPDEAIRRLDERAKAQNAPVLYQVTNHGNPEDAYIEGIHAKIVVTEGPGQQSVTFVGSANATGPGWGSGGAPNVEAVVEMRPGLGVDHFVSGFIRPNKTVVHPWISEYDRSAKADPDEEKELERQILAALREVAKIDLRVRYDVRRQRLTVSKASSRVVLPPWVVKQGLQFSFAPLLVLGSPGSWRAISELDNGSSHFDGTPVDKLSAFVALRAQSRAPILERQRFVVARLEVDESVLAERDQAIRAHILATADPAMVLNALIRGLAHVRTTEVGPKGHAKERSLQALLAETTLERLLQAVALDRGLIGEIRMLLGPTSGPLLRLCTDLESAVGHVYSSQVA